MSSSQELYNRFSKNHVKRVTFLADAGFRDGDWAQLCLNLELCDSGSLQHLQHNARWNLRPLGQFGV